jgi:hypothetical protein
VREAKTGLGPKSSQEKSGFQAASLHDQSTLPSLYQERETTFGLNEYCIHTFDIQKNLSLLDKRILEHVVEFPLLTDVTLRKKK